MLPCASVSEALCCVNRKPLGFVSAFDGPLKAPTQPLLADFFTCLSLASVSCTNTSTACREALQEAVKLSPLIRPFLRSLGCFPAGLATLFVFSHPSLLNMSWFGVVLISFVMCSSLEKYVCYWLQSLTCFTKKHSKQQTNKQTKNPTHTHNPHMLSIFKQIVF